MTEYSETDPVASFASELENELLNQHYFVALALLLDKRGRRFTYTEAEYEMFRTRYGGQAQIVVSQSGSAITLELMREPDTRAN